jgi:Transglycosylase SLT domain
MSIDPYAAFRTERTQLMNATSDPVVKAHFQAELDQVKLMTANPGDIQDHANPGQDIDSPPVITTPPARLAVTAPPPPPPVSYAPPAPPVQGAPAPVPSGSGSYSSVDSGEKLAAVQPIIDNAAAEANVPPDLLSAVMLKESRGVSVNGMQNSGGLMQLSEAKFNELEQKYPDQMAGLSYSSPEGQITGAAFFLKDMYQKSGSWDGAAALYNGGENSGGKLNDPNYITGLHEIMDDLHNHTTLPS